jgi:cellulose synthase/poly-beta-1,6-N-acetylglucosamine synthase-like glycosyltransferase
MKLLAKNRKENTIVFEPGSDLPFISVLMAVYNEDAVITEKIRSIYYTLYPLNKFEVLVGSDASTDGTNNILKVYSENYQHFRFFPFEKRQGKPQIINRLTQEAKGEILIITDANVMLEINTLFELVKHFKNNEIGLVDSFMKNKGTVVHGISVQEKAYISREVSIKHYESITFGTMMGPFGGCFAVRASLFEPIPKNFLVDDFYINMLVFKKKKKAISNLNAVVIEDVSNNLGEEFRRKRRIATGNFQNLKKFSFLLWPPSPLSFCFLSHKVLRWFGPVLMIAAFLSLIFLYDQNLYRYLLFVGVFFLFIPIFDALLRNLNIHIQLLRFITHFASMNMALLAGLFRFITGVKTNIWQPTRRNQTDGNQIK